MTEVSSFLRNLREYVSASPRVKMETTLCFTVIYNIGRWTKPRNLVTLRVIQLSEPCRIYVIWTCSIIIPDYNLQGIAPSDSNVSITKACLLVHKISRSIVTNFIIKSEMREIMSLGEQQNRHNVLITIGTITCIQNLKAMQQNYSNSIHSKRDFYIKFVAERFYVYPWPQTLTCTEHTDVLHGFPQPPAWMGNRLSI
jgi:hypothetical protein